LDAEFVKEKDAETGLWFHDGFMKATDDLFEDITQFLRKDYRTRITGHSLGGAIAVILMKHLQDGGYTVEKVITFGQPKVTNHDGVVALRDSPVLRIVDDRDLVPKLPPLTLLSALHGIYEHFGPEVTLLRDEYFAYQDEQSAEDPLAESFWLNLGDESLDDHHIANYLARIEPKLNGQIEVPYSDRKQYQ
jgi:hypothetical protein